jgi:hypothetical protein
MKSENVRKLVEGVDYYMEGDKLVFTAHYHLARGYCCNSKCRHCPYGPDSPHSPVVQIVGIPGLGSTVKR